MLESHCASEILGGPFSCTDLCGIVGCPFYSHLNEVVLILGFPGVGDTLTALQSLPHIQPSLIEVFHHSLYQNTLPSVF